MGKVDVPGVKEEDLDIKIDDGRITVEGQRMMVSSNEASRFTSKFSKTFSLDPTVDVYMFTASLNNGVLVVSAPKDSAKLEQNIRRIPITAAASIADDSVVLEDDTTEAKQEEKENNEGGNEDKVEIQSSTLEAETEVENKTLNLDFTNNA